MAMEWTDLLAEVETASFLDVDKVRPLPWEQ